MRSGLKVSIYVYGLFREQVHSPENLWTIVKHNTETDIEDEDGGLEFDDEDADDGIVLILVRFHRNTD